uniref:Uncharacterized protein n=1 Tax=Tetradesmus obliquus TaxID=3088 RepID=A0A383VZR6_TETOB|eukprot:jgi/Sobl393_1/19267/SZX70938.1
MPSKEFMSRSKAAQRKQAASGCFCLLLLGFASSTSASTHATRTSTGSSNKLQHSLPRVLLSRPGSSSSSRRQLQEISAGPGLAGVPDWALGTTTSSSSSSSSSSAPSFGTTFLSSQESAAPESESACPTASKRLAAATSPSSLRTPVSLSWDGSAIAWGGPYAPHKDAAGGSVGAVFWLDAEGTCSFNTSSKLPNPLALLPLNYNIEPEKDSGAPSIAQLAVSESANVVLAATTLQAVYSPPQSSQAVTTESAAAPVPYVLAAFSYRKVQKAAGTRPTFVPAGVLPIPAVAAPVVTVTGLSVSLDGKTALVCLMPKCSSSSSSNPSACGSGWAHIFKLAATAAANNTDAGGHTWSLVAQLPYAGYGTPGGHGAACSLSLDGSTAAVLTASTVTETVQVPVSSNSTDSSTDAGTISSSSSTRQRLRALLQSIRSSSSRSATASAAQHRRQRQRRLQQTSSSSSSSSSDAQAQFKPITTTTRSAYLQMYAATAPGGPWAAVGTHPLDAAVAECLLGAAPCRPLVDVSDRFAAVAYVSGPELKADVVFHNAPAAAAGRKWAEFVKVCTLSKLLVAIGTDGNSKAAVTVPDPSADQLANIAIRQPTGTLSLRVLVTTRNPGASYVWTLSRRGEQACPTSPKNLLESINPNYNALPSLTTDVTGDGLVTAVSGLLDAEGSNKLAAVGGY